MTCVPCGDDLIMCCPGCTTSMCPSDPGDEPPRTYCWVGKYDLGGTDYSIWIDANRCAVAISPYRESHKRRECDKDCRGPLGGSD